MSAPQPLFPGPPGPPAGQGAASRKTFTPALIAALAGLAVLAAVTLIVVLRSGDDPGTGAGGTTTQEQTSTQSSTSAAPPSSATTSSPSTSSAKTTSGTAGGVSATDGSFSYALPAGYQDATGQVSGDAQYVAEMYDPNSDAGFPTTLVVTKDPAGGKALKDVVSATRKAIESTLSTTTEDLTPSMSSIDGEDLMAFSTGDYDKNGFTLQSAVVITIHDDTAYAFIVNVRSGKTAAGGDALASLINSVKWS